MRRREFIMMMGAAAAWPLASHAQQGERMRRVGVLMSLAADSPEGQARVAALREGLQHTGWKEGQNIHIELRWGVGDPGRLRNYAAELVALGPDAIVGSGGVSMQALHEATRTIPVVFTSVIDPVGAGYVATLAHPGGNATGFTLFEYGISAKWAELLKQIAPSITRLAVLRAPTATSGTAQFAAIQSVAPSLRLDVNPVSTEDPTAIEESIRLFARTRDGGIVVLAGASATLHRDLIVRVAAENEVPAVYFDRFFVSAGGLMSYGPDQVDRHRSAAGYVDRILRGEKAADLPVQAPTRYELVINLKTAKALGLDVPLHLQQRADEVIE